MTRTVLSTLAATAATAAMLISLSGPAEAYKCKATFTKAEAIHKLRIKSAASARGLWAGKVKGTYGLPWSVWNIASGKAVSCSHTGAAYYCVARARPCLYVVQ